MTDVNLSIMIDDIIVNEGRREICSTSVKKIAQSIEQIGLRHPITVKRKGDQYVLIAGRHRLEAFKKLDREHIPANIVTMTNDEARLWEIAENLHRAELTKLERDEQVAEWIKITERVSRQVDAKPQGGRPEGGTRAAARELGIDEADARRAVKVSSLSEEAKQAARDVGLDDNRSALLSVAKEPTPEAQVAKVGEIAAVKSRSSNSDRMPNPPPQTSRRPSSPAEAMDFANTLRVSLSALDPVIDRIGEMGELEFFRLIGESEASALVGILRPWLERVDSIVSIHKNRGRK